MVNNVMASSIYVYLLVSIYQKMEWGFKGQGVITVNRLWELGKSLIFSVTISVMLPRSLFVGLFSLLRARRISAFDGIDDGGFDGEAFLRVGQIAHRLFVILDHSHLLIENVNVVFLGSVFPPHLQPGSRIFILKECYIASGISQNRTVKPVIPRVFVDHEEFEFVRSEAISSEFLLEDLQLFSLDLTKTSAGRVEGQHRHASAVREFFAGGGVPPFGRLGAGLRLGGVVVVVAKNAADEGRKEEGGDEEEEKPVTVSHIWTTTTKPQGRRR